ncbi:MAG: UDP-glucose 4-epimerase GalE [Candidatus Marinimicrobia bacterium]|nr:UDP-glucose 4-epimerase GalE [Candidatus Neomarinimicrobiota bacterium]
MRILVTGGAGYIGSHVVYEFIDQGHNVTIFDDLSLGVKENIDNRAKFVFGSTLSEFDLNKVFQNKFDGVVHLAAWKAAGESMVNPAKYAINNLNGTINLICACNKYRIKNFVFSSTASVYGIPCYIPMDEGHPTMPINYYGETKLQIEKNLAWFSRLKGLSYVALRYFNAAGYDINGRIKGKERSPQNLIPIVMETAAGIQPQMEVYGNDYDTKDGTGVRDYVHVNDLAIAHVLAMEYLIENSDNLTLNLATGKGHSVMDVINKAEQITKSKINYKFTDRRKGDPPTVLAISKKVNDILKWKPRYSDLETLIQSSWKIYKN